MDEKRSSANNKTSANETFSRSATFMNNITDNSSPPGISNLTLSGGDAESSLDIAINGTEWSGNITTNEVNMTSILSTQTTASVTSEILKETPSQTVVTTLVNNTNQNITPISWEKSNWSN